MNKRVQQSDINRCLRGYLARQGQFFYLLLAMLLFMLAYPALERQGFHPALSNLFVVVVLVCGVFAVSETRGPTVIALLLSVPHLLLSWETVVFGRAVSATMPLVHMASMALTILFYLFTICMLLSSILRREQVSLDIMYGAMCVYILLGAAWGALYARLEAHRPGSFYLDDGHHLNQVVDGFDLMFYSFVTLTTVGYGDITPATSPARALTILEAVTGVFYVAIFIAQLVNGYRVQSTADPPCADVGLPPRADSQGAHEHTPSMGSPSLITQSNPAGEFSAALVTSKPPVADSETGSGACGHAAHRRCRSMPQGSRGSSAG
jgi:voltage-gated potassium channel